MSGFSDRRKEKIKPDSRIDKIFDLSGREIKKRSFKKGIYFIRKKAKIEKLIITR